MFSSALSASRKSILTQSMRGFGTTICVMAGSPSWDVTGARVMKWLKQVSPEPITFVGIGGDEMKAEGLSINYADINTFPNKPTTPHKNHLRWHIVQPFHPVMANLHAKNRAVVKQMVKNNFLVDCIDNVKPSLFLTFGNEFFMRRLYKELDGEYAARNLLKPPMMHYDKLLINQRFEFSTYVDHWLYTVPKDPMNWRYYKFPSTYVGIWSVARAIEYLYKSSPKHQHLVSDNTLLISGEFNYMIMETLIQNERQKFRQQNNIEESVNLFYTLPGNSKEEILWAIPLIHGTVSHFVKKFPDFSAENFAVVIPSLPHIENLIVDTIGKYKWPIRVIVTKNAEERYSALAASDMAACVNGDAVAECAAYQIPTVILNKMSFFQSYVTLLYNSFSNDLNIALGGEAYPETIGQAFPEKVVEYWADWFTKPRNRYNYIQRFESFVPKLVPKVGERDLETPSDTKAIVEDGISFEKYYFSEYLAAKKILEAKDAYHKAAQTNPRNFEIRNVRGEMLKAINV